MRTPVLAIVLLVPLLLVPRVAAADGLALAPPVEGASVRAFEDVGRYEKGHRGVDLSADVGVRVRAAAEGRVHFAGSVAGVPTLSIDHGNGWRTTYQPVLASVSRGEAVEQGQVVGSLGAGHCVPRACLHWGLTDGTRYADPMAYLTTPEIRLVPHGTEPVPPPPVLGAATAAGPVGGLPVRGRHTSPFGMRRHPVTGVWKLHDGTDLAAACGTPVVAPSPGTVTRAYFHAAYGWRVFVDHGGGLVTAYNHLPGLEVRPGVVLRAGQRLGAVGNTGLSTGCHLHWMAWQAGRLIDPLTLVT